MIAKCIFVLAVVAQIRASGCGCGLSSMGSPQVFLSSGNSGFGDSSSGSSTRNLVASGKYPVALRNCGPAADQHIPVTTSRITTPVQERPTVRLPTCIPGPKTISHSCTCYKTILRPRVHQQIITVPTVQRYVETAHKPVVENIQYEALPVSCGCSSGSGMQLVQLGSGGSSSSSSGTVELVPLSSNSCGSQVRAIEIPSVQIQPVQIQIPQTVSYGSCSC